MTGAIRKRGVSAADGVLIRGVVGPVSAEVERVGKRRCRGAADDDAVGQRIRTERHLHLEGRARAGRPEVHLMPVGRGVGVGQRRVARVQPGHGRARIALRRRHRDGADAGRDRCGVACHRGVERRAERAVAQLQRAQAHGIHRRGALRHRPRTAGHVVRRPDLEGVGGAVGKPHHRVAPLIALVGAGVGPVGDLHPVPEHGPAVAALPVFVARDGAAAVGPRRRPRQRHLPIARRRREFLRCVRFPGHVVVDNRHHEVRVVAADGVAELDEMGQVGSALQNDRELFDPFDIRVVAKRDRQRLAGDPTLLPVLREVARRERRLR